MSVNLRVSNYNFSEQIPHQKLEVVPCLHLLWDKSTVESESVDVTYKACKTYLWKCGDIKSAGIRWIGLREGKQERAA